VVVVVLLVRLLVLLLVLPSLPLVVVRLVVLLRVLTLLGLLPLLGFLRLFPLPALIPLLYLLLLLRKGLPFLPLFLRGAGLLRLLLLRLLLRGGWLRLRLGGLVARGFDGGGRGWNGPVARAVAVLLGLCVVCVAGVEGCR